jgi:hypothetical protein
VSLAGAYMAYSGPMGLFRRPAVLRQKATYSFIELVRPDGYPVYTIEQRFGILRWMAATARATTPTKAETGAWGAENTFCLLNCHPTCVNDDRVYAIQSLDDLDRRFHFALLSANAGASARRWRKENGISVTEQKILHFPHFKPFAGAPLQGKPRSEAYIKKAVTSLLAYSAPLVPQLNRYHARARETNGVKIHVLPWGFRFVLDYGYDGSTWYHELAATPNMWSGQGETFRYNPYGADSETFMATLDRAITALDELQKVALPSPVDAEEPTSQELNKEQSK